MTALDEAIAWPGRTDAPGDELRLKCGLPRQPDDFRPADGATSTGLA
jgi:hypothetical protein